MAQIYKEINKSSLSWIVHFFKAVLFSTKNHRVLPSCKQHTQKKRKKNIPYLQKNTLLILNVLMLRRRTWSLIHTLQQILKWWQVENKFPVWEHSSLLSAVLQRSNIRVGVLVFPFLATFTKMTEETRREGGFKGERNTKRHSPSCSPSCSTETFAFGIDNFLFL